MINYLVEVLVALPDNTWFIVEQEVMQADDGDFKACEKARKVTERELKQRKVEFVLTATYHYTILEEIT